MNLVETILKSLGGDALANLARSLGIGEEETKAAAGAAVPALLSGLGSLAASPDGAKKLWSAVKGVDDTVPADFARLVGGEEQDVLSKMGSGLLEGLFGKSTLSALTNVLGKFLGGKTALVTKLLPMIAPLIMGTLSKQVKEKGFDLGGLTKMLAGQKDNIAKAMPSGLMSSLSSAQGLGDLAGFAKGASDTVASAGRAASSTTRAAAATAASPLRWAVPLLLLAVVLGGLYWMNNRTEPGVVGENADPIATQEVVMDEVVTNTVQKPVDQAATMKENLDDSLSNIGTTLKDITDIESAKAALPKLEDMSSRFETLKTTFNALPEASRPTIAKAADASLGKLEEQRERIEQIPGVGEILKPILDRIFETLSAITRP